MPSPKKAYLEITNVCNLACAFCPGTKRKPKSLTREEFRFLANRVRPWAQYLYFHLMGEPTAHPLLPEFLRLANEMGFRTVITTNGTLLARRGEALLAEDCRPYKISISLHAFEANDISVPFEDYISSCIAFAKEAAVRGTIAVLRLWNLDGRAEGAMNRKNEAVLAMLHDAFADNWVQTRSGYRLCDRVFLEWGEKFDWPELSSPVLHETGFCYGLRDQIGVLADGTVVPCCLDHDGDIPLGNLFEMTLDEILSSPRAKAIYDGFTMHRCAEDLCRRCMRAGYYRQ